MPSWATTVIDDSFVVCLVWGLGLLAQALLSLRGWLTVDDAATVLWSALGSLFGFIPFRHERGYHPHQHVLSAFVIFVFIIASRRASACRRPTPLWAAWHS